MTFFDNSPIDFDVKDPQLDDKYIEQQLGLSQQQPPPEQQYIEPQQFPTYGQMPRVNKDAEFTRWQLDVSDTLHEIEHLLRGEVQDPRTKEWQARYDRYMNDEGVAYMMQTLRIYLDRNHMLSNYSEDEIHEICGQVMLSVIEVLYMNYERFEIDKSRLTSLVNIIDHTVQSTLKRAWGAQERTTLRESSIRQEVHSINKNPTNSGFLSFFKREG